MDAEEFSRRLDDEALTLLDVRTAAEYEGAGGYPCDPRQGHLPGARQLDVAALADCATLDEVRELVGLPAGAEIIAYCHSGSRSEFAAQLLRAAGYDARNYGGSWHEWSRLDLPIEP